LRRIYPDHGRATWQAELLALCQHIRSVLMEHPHWTELLSRAATPPDVPVRERILSMMVDDGMPPDLAWTALWGAALGSIGFVLAELTMRGQNGVSSIERRFERLREWTQTTETVPVTSAAVRATKFDIDAVFGFMLRSLVEGIAQRPESAVLGTSAL